MKPWWRKAMEEPFDASRAAIQAIGLRTRWRLAKTAEPSAEGIRPYAQVEVLRLLLCLW